MSEDPRKYKLKQLDDNLSRMINHAGERNRKRHFHVYVNIRCNNGTDTVDDIDFIIKLQRADNRTTYSHVADCYCDRRGDGRIILNQDHLHHIVNRVCNLIRKRTGTVTPVDEGILKTKLLQFIDGEAYDVDLYGMHAVKSPCQFDHMLLKDDQLPNWHVKPKEKQDD